MWLWAWLLLLGLAAALPTTVPPVPLTSVNITGLFGWQQCGVIGSNARGLSLPAVNTYCTGPNLMIACRAPGSQILNVAAAAPRGDTMTALTRYQNTTFGLDGTRWVAVAYPAALPANCLLASGATSICWNMDANGTVQTGGFCGNVGYTTSNTVERVVYTDPCGGGLVLGSPCSNNRGMCSSGNTCAADGSCGGGTDVVCPAPTQCEASITCNIATGACDTVYRPSGYGCDDGDNCTLLDQCNGAGACVGGSPKACPLAGNCQVLVGCLSPSGNCSYTDAPDGYPCSDGSACTDPDSCAAGVCVPGPETVCTPAGPCYGNGTCNPLSGQCSTPPLANGTLCTNPDLCALTSVCQDAVCTGTTFVTCSPIGGCYSGGTCLAAFGNCTTPTAPALTPCSNSPCYFNRTCNGQGICANGQPTISCPASDQCHLPGAPYEDTPFTCACTNPVSPPGVACEDGDVCTRNDTCLAGSCVPGATISCPGDDCNFPLGVCNPSTGCLNPRPNGTVCVSADPCRINTVCYAGVCAGGENDSSNINCSPASVLYAFIAFFFE